MDEKAVDDRKRPLLRQCFVTANVSMSILGNGCAFGIVAVLLPSLRTKESHIHATANEESWIAAALALAFFFGTALLTVLVDKVGRRKSHFLAVLLVLIGWVVLQFATNVTGLIVARLLQGLGIGIFGFLGSIIIGEMTEPKYRGTFTSVVSLSLTAGVLLSHTLGSYFPWETNALICSFVTFTSLIMILYTPESPSWLISKARYQEASDVFFWLRGNGDLLEKEFDKMVTAHKIVSKLSADEPNISITRSIKRFFRYYIETFKKPAFYKPTIIMISLYTVYQFAGIHIMNTFATDIITQIVGPEANSSLLMIVLDVERLVCNILAVYLIKIMTRRTLLFTTGFGCALAYFAQAGYVYLKQGGNLPYDHQWIPITLIAFYTFTLTVGISSVPLVLAGELFPLEYRGLGSGISTLTLSVNFFIAVKMFPVLNNSIGLPLTYSLYSSMVVVSLIITWFLLPETKDRTLQDIEDIFRGYSPEDVKSSVPLKEKEMMEVNYSSQAT